MFKNNFDQQFLKPKIIILSGATASGKSNIANNIALQYNSSIINADSMQVYQDLPILSAQPNKDVQQKISHYLYGFMFANDKMTVANWLDLVEDAIKESVRQSKLPIIVGGTGMYISRLIEGIAKIPNIEDEFKQESLNLYAKIGHLEFVKKFGNQNIIDKQKLLRRCEVFLQTGKDIDYFLQQNHYKILQNYEFLHLNLNPLREQIYFNCNKRFDNMIKNGALEEVKNFIEKKPNYLNYNITKTLGFNEIINYLLNKLSFEEMQNLATQKTRNYAKRQLTWFRNQFKELNYCLNEKQILENVKKFMNHEI
jgi:tRNA dimethylallyltransferase